MISLKYKKERGEYKLQDKNIEKIKKILNTKSLQKKCKRFTTHDYAITKDDLVQDIYLEILEDNLIINEENIHNILNKKYRKVRNNWHFPLRESTQYIVIDDDENIDELIGYAKEYSFTDDELLTLLYIRDKSKIRKYDYSFLRRKNGVGVDYTKLSKILEKMLLKIIDKKNNTFFQLI